MRNAGPAPAEMPVDIRRARAFQRGGSAPSIARTGALDAEVRKTG